MYDIPCSNVLVIGNGFDLHHKMKTKYIDYIDFIQKLIKNNDIIEDDKNISNTNYEFVEFSKNLKEFCQNYYIKEGFSEKALQDIWLTVDNSFVKYFLSYCAEVEGWIDFEILIKVITVNIDQLIERLNNNDYEGEDKYKSGIICGAKDCLLAKCFNMIFSVRSGYVFINEDLANYITGINKKRVLCILRKEFDVLCEGLTIYLKEIEPIYRNYKEGIKYKQIENIKADAIITFNYTDTYKRYNIKAENILHVHGSLAENNIILGFNDDNEKDLNYVYFKKYMQCILKHTPRLDQYNFSVEKTNEDFAWYNEPPIIHFFGHSLDITDKEKLLFLFDNASEVKIYFYDEDDYEEKIERIISLLEKKRALSMIYCNAIEFIKIDNALC